MTTEIYTSVPTKMKYYKIQYHKKDEHVDNWYDREGYNRYDTELEAYRTLVDFLQQKLVVFMYPDIDRFRIMFVNEQEVYTTWNL